MGWALITSVVAITAAWAGPKEQAPEPLTETGKELMAGYTAMMEELQAELAKVVPVVDERKSAAFVAACESEKEAEEGLAEANTALGEINKWRGLVAHANGKWIGEADRGIAAAREELKKAKTDEARQAGEKEIARWQKNREEGLEARKERQANLDRALAKEPELKRGVEDAKAVLAEAQARTTQALKALGLGSFLKSDKLDAKFAKHAVLAAATPHGLAVYAQQGSTQEELVKELLSDEDLMIRMQVAGGAYGRSYGKAMEAYTAILNESGKAKDGVLQKLALATSLELTPKEAEDAVKRYLHFEKAYLDGELDPAFETMSAWDYRNVVNGDENEECLAWGREMLRNYRPDHITNPDFQWRYVGAVRTDIRYGSQYNRFDDPELHRYQNILANGGVCGRRAFFGRFILRAFGIPTVARPQGGHAALAHWTPEGWVVCLGSGWGTGWVGVEGKRKRDLDFLAINQARAAGEPYMEVLRAQWMGDVQGEPRAWGLASSEPGPWNSIALYWQRAIIQEARVVTLAAVGEELSEANVSKVDYAIETAPLTEADRTISVENGVITIPAAATSKPGKNTGTITFMPSVLGGMQLHYARTGGAETFEYTFDAPKAGNYRLAARVVTPSPKQLLTVTANGAEEPVEIALPYTLGMWDSTQPVEITLVEGENVLTFARAGEDKNYIRGLTIRDFTLTPAKESKQVQPLDTLTGVVVRKGWTKSLESWNAGGSDYYVLKVETADLPPNKRTAKEGVILRPSKAIPFEHFSKFVGQKVKCKGEYVAGKPYNPPKEDVEQMPSSLPKLPNLPNGKADHLIRGSGFKVYLIEPVEKE